MHSIGVDLGGTKILTGLIRETGEIVRTVERETRAERGVESVISAMISSIVEVKGDVPVTDISGIGIGAPGPLDSKRGLVLSPPNLPGWTRVPLRQHIGNHFGVPAFLENDANAAALAEFKFGAGQGAQNMIYVTVSTGIGAGLILNGKLYGGAGGYAGEVGHIVVKADGPHCICGNRGCLESLSSGTAIAARAEEVFGRPCTAKEVAELAIAGDSEATALLDEAFYYLGQGFVSLVNLFNPSKIVVGGGVSQIGDMLFDKVRQVVKQHAFSAPGRMVEIVPARLGAQSGMIGGAVLPFLNTIDSEQPVLDSKEDDHDGINVAEFPTWTIQKI